MNHNKLNRRVFCAGILGRGAFMLGAGSLISACGGSQNQTGQEQDKPIGDPSGEVKTSTTDPCTDFSNVEQSELEKRAALGYVEKSPIPDNLCENCKLFIPWESGQNCGGCQLFKGPVFLDAYCTYWADAEI